VVVSQPNAGAPLSVLPDGTVLGGVV